MKVLALVDSDSLDYKTKIDDDKAKLKNTKLPSEPRDPGGGRLSHYPQHHHATHPTSLGLVFTLGVINSLSQCVLWFWEGPALISCHVLLYVLQFVFVLVLNLV